MRYLLGSKVNLIGLSNMRFLCRFRLRVAVDHPTAWLTKETLKLEFPMNAESTIWVQAWDESSPRGGREKRASTAKLLHGGLNHASMTTAKELIDQDFDFGVIVNAKDLTAYDCVPCISRKTKRMTYQRKLT